MNPRHKALVALIVGANLYLVPHSSAATRCGDVDPATKQSTRAALTLDENSVTNLSYKRKTNTRTLLLIFKATGCDLGSSQPDPRVDVLPKQGSDELPDGVVSLKTAVPDGSDLSVRLGVDEHKFDPGSYGGLVEMRAPYLNTTRTPIAVSRSENRIWIPFGLGALAGLVSILWFGALKFLSREKLQINGWWLTGVAAAACAFGGFAVVSSYVDQEVWTLADNFKAAILAGIAGATTGTMATMLAVIWKATPVPTPPPAPGPTPAPAPAPVAQR